MGESGQLGARNDMCIRKYPHIPVATGPAYADIVNARLEMKALVKPPVDFKKLPFDTRDVLEELENLPYDPGGEPGYGQ